LLVLFPQEGRLAIVTDVGCGMRWTRHVRRRLTLQADGEVVWSWRSDAGAKFAKTLPRLASDGGKRARSPGRARRTPLKPSRRECRLMRYTCGC